MNFRTLSLIGFIGLIPGLGSATPTGSIKAWGFERIRAPAARDQLRPRRTIVVAVIDTGIDARHPDLAGVLWTNPGESGRDDRGRDRRTNGVDDDRNGFVDDVHGWNFVNQSADLTDHHGHGTHISGLIASQGTTDKTLTGVAPEARLMILKYYDPLSPPGETLGHSVRALEYATRMRADIINYSGGGPAPSLREEAALKAASAKGVLVVAAAGNESSDTDQRKYYPANYELPNILAVAALTPRSMLVPSSNFGFTSVDIAAPGGDIHSTLPGMRFGAMTGTSQATALVSGAAALVMSRRPDLRGPQKVIEQLLKTGLVETDLAGKVRAGVTLDALAAVASRDRTVDAFDQPVPWEVEDRSALLKPSFITILETPVRKEVAATPAPRL